jgi:hypothetical protein
MVSATANATKFTQNYQNLPKMISLRNFEMPPKIEILVFLKKIKIKSYV